MTFHYYIYYPQWGRSAHHYASAGGHTEVVSHLRSVGRVDIDRKDEVGGGGGGGAGWRLVRVWFM